jgi:hypothetical protein
MPSKVVYQETIASRQLATKRILTIGRLTPAKSAGVADDTNLLLESVTQMLAARFHLLTTVSRIIPLAAPLQDHIA